MIVRILMTTGLNCLLAALYPAGSSDVYQLVVLGLVMVVYGFEWLVEMPHKHGKASNRFSDMLTVLIGCLLIFGWVMLRHWSLMMVLLLECVLHGCFFFQHRPKRR